MTLYAALLSISGADPIYKQSDQNSRMIKTAE